MPLEIRELVIKVNIEKNAASAPEMDMQKLADMKQDIIRECTKAILSSIGTITER
jgi:hypothetical protein